MNQALTAAQRYTISQIKASNKENGRYFFDRASMRFFNSKVLPTVYQGQGGIYFVTSEQFDYSSPRNYTVRQFNPETGEVDTVGKFNEMTADQARSKAKLYAVSGYNA